MPAEPGPPAAYNRASAAQILASVAAGALRTAALDRHFPSAYAAQPELIALTPAPGSHLTTAQLSYVQSHLQPCLPDLLTSATHKTMWQDSDGTRNVAHCGPSRLGPIVPVVAREVVLVLRRAVAANTAVRAAVDALPPYERATMAATTTDRDPMEILNVGFETTARALVQHAYLADQTPYRTPAEFARRMRKYGVFAVVANTWFWGLQSDTFRRGMIPVNFDTRSDGDIRYTNASTSMLRAMKDATIARQHSDDTGLARQYGNLAPGEQPRCLANMPTAVAGRRFILLPEVVDVFVDTFVRLLDVVTVAGDPEEEPHMAADEVFEVPDMTCSHCTNTVTGVLEAHGASVTEIDLDSKKVIAAFPSNDVRERAFDAIREQGYTVVPPVAS